MGLALYKQKRNFKETPEPSGGKAGKGKGLSFVVQRHHASRLHYDFRLELEGVLKSWAVPKGPSMVAGEKRLAVMVEDHPLPYGKFYGEIPEGNYGAGTVHIWDHGTYTPMEKTAAGEAEKVLLAQLKKGDLKFTLKGTHLNGSFALVRMHDDSGKNWLLIKKSDDFAVKKYNITSIDPVKAYNGKVAKSSTPKATAKKAALKKTAVKKNTANTVEDKAETKQASKASGSNGSFAAAWKRLQHPMMAKLVEGISNDEAWVYEAKYDGYRAVTGIHKGKVEMLSRNGNSFNRQYSPLVKELGAVSDDVILDGEVVIEDDNGTSNFQLLQNFTTTQKGTLKYYVFDLLFLNGHTLTDLPLVQRRELLGSFMETQSFINIVLSDAVQGKGEQLLKKLSAKGYEGIIAKDQNSTYMPGKRSASWLKVKSVMMQEAVICGYTLPQNSRKYFGSLILGIYKGKELKYIGNCGTGFTNASLEELHGKFSKLETSACPFPVKPALVGAKGKAVWMKPELVCNVKFLQWTADEHLRNPVFMGLRNDKSAKDVINESKTMTGKKKAPAGNAGKKEQDAEIAIGRKKVKCTNLSKVYWPDEGLTKGDLIAYYRSVSSYILPYLKDRPQSLNRHPNGIKGPSFYQKDMDVDQLPSWAKTVALYSKSNDADIDYLICNDEATLVYMANLGCIEINPWHSRYMKPDLPDYMIMDLDPGKISFKEVVKTALAVKEICDELEIPCFCKTSGATGLHIYIPLGAKYDYDDVKIAAELLATLTHQRVPKITSLERTVSKRGNKIYVDFLQNRKGQTIAAPYSVRPKPHATVSTPLLWEEVNEQLDPRNYTIHNTLERLEKMGDLWAGVLSKPVALKKILSKLEKLLGTEE
jgi:bifunctional non-homologous end joining protein LigD